MGNMHRILGGRYLDGSSRSDLQIRHGLVFCQCRGTCADSGRLTPIELMKPEKPDFFLSIPLLGSLVSSEYLFGLSGPFPFPFPFPFILSKLAERCKAGGGGLRREFWYPVALVESRLSAPNMEESKVKGAPINSSEVWVLSWRDSRPFMPPLPIAEDLDEEMSASAMVGEFWEDADEV